MTRILSVRVNVEEEAFMRRQMEIAGESQLGPHIKRVYFGNLKPGEGVLPELRRNTELALSMLAELSKRGAPLNEASREDLNNRDLELRLLSAIFVMLHTSVGNDSRTFISRYINYQAVETYLKSGSDV